MGSTDSSEAADTDILSAFNSLDCPSEPLTISRLAEMLDYPEQRIDERLDHLVAAGELHTKQLDSGTRVWWRRSESETDTTDPQIPLRGELFNSVQEIANLGVWEYNLRTSSGWWTEAISRIHGLSPEEKVSAEESLEFYHPDDRPRIERAFENALQDGEPYDLELRLIDANDELRWVRTRGQPQYEEGELVRLRGTLQDITERKKRERELERTQTLLTNVEQLGDIGAWEFDLDTRTGRWSEGARQVHGVDDEFDPTLDDALDFFHPDDRETVSQLIEQCIETGEPYSTEQRLLTADGTEKWVSMKGELVAREDEPDAICGYIQDITDRKERDQLKRLDQLNTVIRTIAKAVVQARERDEIITAVCERLLEFDSYQFTVAGEFTPSRESFETWMVRGDGDQYLRELLACEESPPLSESLGAAAADSGEVQVYQTLEAQPVDEWREIAATHDIESMAAIPLVYQDTVFGVVGLYSDQPDAFERQIQIGLAELGEIVGYALSALERCEVLDSVVEIEFRSETLAEPFLEATDEPVSLEFDSAVTRADGTQLEYWTVQGVDPCTYKRIVEEYSAVETRLLSTVGERSRFEVATNAKSIASIATACGGTVQSVTIQDGTAVVIGEFPERADTGAIVSQLQERYPDIELTGRQRVLTPTYLRRLIEDNLTERQSTVLQTAYFGGYFDRPRLSTGEELADRLEITKQTFHEHLRKAQKGVFQELFKTSGNPHGT